MIVEGYEIKAYRSCYRGNLFCACGTVGMVRMDVHVANVLKEGYSIHSILIGAQELQPCGHWFFHDHDMKQENCNKRSNNPYPPKRA